MTSTVDRMYTIFEAQDPTECDAAFDVDQLKDIVNHGMSQGVPMFTYTKDCVQWFNENEDTIEEYLSDWYFDTLGERNYLAALCTDERALPAPGPGPVAAPGASHASASGISCVLR